MNEMTEEYVLNVLFKEFERIIQEGIKNKEDLEIFSKVVSPKYSYNSNTIETKIFDTLRYIYAYNTNTFYNRETPKSNFSHMINDFEIENYSIMVNFINGPYYSTSKTTTNEDLVNNFISNIEYVNEDFYSIYHYIHHNSAAIKYFKKDIWIQILTYHLKKKRTKTIFSYMLHQNLIDGDILKEVKLTDKQFIDLVFTEFKSLTKKSIKVADITSLKQLRNIKNCFTEGVILEIVQKFINEESSPDTIEVILSMFFHYLGLNFDDYPEAKLLLTIAIDKEIDV